MTDGISTTNVANPILNWLRGVAPPTVPGLFAKLHVGDPGAVGADNPSVVTLRVQVTMNAAAGGAITLNAVSGSWPMTASETIPFISIHDAVTGGNFLWSAPVLEPPEVNNGDTLTASALTLGNSPLAA